MNKNIIFTKLVYIVQIITKTLEYLVAYLSKESSKKTTIPLSFIFCNYYEIALHSHV